METIMELSEMKKWREKHTGCSGAGQARMMIKSIMRGRTDYTVEEIVAAIDRYESSRVEAMNKRRKFFAKRAKCRCAKFEIISHEEKRCVMCGKIHFIEDAD